MDQRFVHEDRGRGGYGDGAAALPVGMPCLGAEGQEEEDGGWRLDLNHTVEIKSGSTPSFH